MLRVWRSERGFCPGYITRVRTPLWHLKEVSLRLGRKEFTSYRHKVLTRTICWGCKWINRNKRNRQIRLRLQRPALWLGSLRFLAPYALLLDCGIKHCFWFFICRSLMPQKLLGFLELICWIVLMSWNIASALLSTGRMLADGNGSPGNRHWLLTNRCFSHPHETLDVIPRAQNMHHYFLIHLQTKGWEPKGLWTHNSVSRQLHW